jgi:hypothetical protein
MTTTRRRTLRSPRLLLRLSDRIKRQLPLLKTVANVVTLLISRPMILNFTVRVLFEDAFLLLLLPVWRQLL